jgi:LemA protein
MKTALIILGVLLVLVLVAFGWLWGGRGALIDRSQSVNEKWAQVQNVYQRRFDLVPNLVASVDNFMARQQSTLTEVIGMRQRVIDLKSQAESALGSGNPALLDSVSNLLSRQLNSYINVVVERYPDIKGEQMYSDLLTQLEGTENRIAQERRTYNESVREYNAYRQRYLKTLAAGAVFGFPYERAYFAADTSAQKAPDVRQVFNKP